MSQKYKCSQLGLILVLSFCIVVSSCATMPPQPKTLTPRNTPLPPTATIPPPAETTLLPTETSLPDQQTLSVPVGTSITIDGSFRPGEWDRALKVELNNGGALFLSSYQDDLYLGLQSSEMSYGSICVVRDEQIVILHSSAALGSAIYEELKSAWNLTQEFSWCCRSMSPVSEKEALYTTEGWLARMV